LTKDAGREFIENQNGVSVIRNQDDLFEKFREIFTK